VRTRTLSHDEARRAYDRIGSLQDSQAFYEDVATSLLLQHGDFPSARSVFEFGCGTGRFAQRLLEEQLTGDDLPDVLDHTRGAEA
jgi:SAM-dependent methyltransferase